MVVVDSSVWIDHFNGKATKQVMTLQMLIRMGPNVIVGDLILAEVLQGTKTDQEFARCCRVFTSFNQMTIANTDTAIQAAQNYRTLRTLGITPRKTIDTLIATRCIIDNIPLLYSDRDFDPFVAHLGLKSALLA